ncbi:protein ALP1-like isoform X2 [Cajanus cajan]|uniref:Nuclease HARBI1 n=1 Tax=Cajanus cajan TaxID=3821 RepID=A0A151T5B8_CAJCA|nr:protein ALP1-like isoform X1 [Cajanus cajan]XP_029128236.1 protein ALP1-like isoform X2 [Cajanus cajan]KYP62248.1 Putative nuclease HARBI1 [Cajanus cajan]
MEIGPVPFLTPEDYSHFYNLFSDADPNNNNNNSSSNRKRNRKEDEGHNGNNNTNDSDLKDLLASLIVLDEEEAREERNRIIESEQHRAIFNATFDHQAQSMNTYKAQFEAHYAQSDELDHKAVKKARRAATAAATASVQTQTASVQIQNQTGSESGSVQRRLWVKDRSKDWWERISRNDFPEEEFRRWFRMSRSTFDMICDELDAAITKKNTMLRDAIPVRQRVAVCIWRLATGDPLRLVSKRFGLGISTCHKLVLEVCGAIRTVLMPKFLNWPSEEKMKRVKEDFESISGIQNIGGSMYTTHIPIIAPKISVSAYFNKRHTERNQKTSYSITVQGVVDSKGVFSDVCIGWPGSMADDKILEKSALYERASRGSLRDVWIVGNSGHPLMDWVLVPYTHKNLTWTQHAFNEKVEEVQGVGKRAFARLKGRWGCLQKRTEVKLQDLPVVLGACCVLHNICEMRNEEMEAQWDFEIFDDEMVAENGIRSATSLQARDQIAHYLLHHAGAGTAFL